MPAAKYAVRSGLHRPAVAYELPEGVLQKSSYAQMKDKFSDQIRSYFGNGKTLKTTVANTGLRPISFGHGGIGFDPAQITV